MILLQSYYGYKPLQYWELCCWVLSYESIRKHIGDNIVVFSNNKKLVPFECELLPDIHDEQFKRGWWQIYKQYLYKEMNEPFLHIDTDLIFEKNITLSHCDIICEKIRSNNLITNIAESLGLKRPSNIICSGIMGGHNLDIYKQNWNLVYPFMRDFKGNIRDSYRWSVEEVTLTSLSSNLSIQSLENTHQHFQGRMQKTNHNIHKYILSSYIEYKDKYEDKIQEVLFNI